jgi:peroxiredoxin
VTISVGDKLPAATFKEKTADGPVEINTDQLFAGKKVVLFAVPGAFTPTCSLNHLPGYLENRDAILARGIDDIAVVAVNDLHVMGAWATASGASARSISSPTGTPPSPRRSAWMSTFPPEHSVCARSAIRCWWKTAW